ncbi:hypothetical protein HMI54_011772 [Coelomomyces lativittatus]|nr:hypothetical protein HMI54_011772 [Coelomomyces lativittatus]
MIALFHDGYNFTLEALPKIVEQLRAKGISFVDLPTCLNKSSSSFYRSSSANQFNNAVVSKSISSTSTQTTTTQPQNVVSTTTQTTQTTPTTTKSVNSTNNFVVGSDALTIFTAKNYVVEILSVLLVTVGLL